MVRWDSPLFTIPWSDRDVPADDIWKAITEGNVKPPNAGTQAVRIRIPSYFDFHLEPHPLHRLFFLFIPTPTCLHMP